MTTPNIVIGGKTSMAVDGAVALRKAADERGFTGPIRVVPNRTDSGLDDWQPSFKRFAQSTRGFEICNMDAAYELPNLYFFSLEFDRLVNTTRTESENLFNIHFSLLPAYKGMSTSVTPLLDGRSESGVTLHRIDRGIDTGPIIEQRAFAIGPDDTARDLYFNYIAHGTSLFVSMVGHLLDGTFSVRAQAPVGSSYFSKREIDYSSPITNFSKTAYELRNRIRGFTFPEYQLVSIDGLEVQHSRITDALSTGRPGTVVSREHGIRRIATIDYDLEIHGRELDD